MAYGQITDYKKLVYTLFDRMMAEEDTSWSFSELYNLPIVLRNFFVSQMEKRIEKKKEAYEKSRKKGRK